MLRPSSRSVLIASAVLAIVEGGYLVADAIRRFVIGDFFRIGGQLGPWAALVGAVGINPLAMGPVFLILGVAQVAAALLLLLRHPSGENLVLVMALGTVWYLIFGAISSVIQIGFIIAAKRARIHRP